MPIEAALRSGKAVQSCRAVANFDMGKERLHGSGEEARFDAKADEHVTRSGPVVNTDKEHTYGVQKSILGEVQRCTSLLNACTRTSAMCWGCQWT